MSLIGNRRFSVCLLARPRPDLYLIKEQLWVEVKGYWYPGAKDKWDEFHTSIQKNSELWDQKKLKKMGIL